MALPASAGTGHSGTVPAGRSSAAASRLAVHAVVVDDGHAAARLFGSRFDARGVPVIPVRDGDITAPWLGSIRPEWARRRATIAGLTTPATLFCLEQLAWQHGLRVVFHAEHIMLPDGSFEHHVQRDALMARLTVSTLQRAGSRWPARVAEAVAARSSVPGRRPGPSLAALQPALPEGAQLLTSWIIAAA